MCLEAVVFFLSEKYSVEEESDKEECDDDEYSGERREFVEGDRKDEQRPNEPDPQPEIFFVDLGFKADTEEISQDTENECQENEDGKKLRQTETDGDEGRKERFDGEEGAPAEKTEDESFC